VYMGFGSMTIEFPLRVINAFAQALTKLNMRGIFCAGWGWQKLLTARDEEATQSKVTERLLEEQKNAELRASTSIDTSGSVSHSEISAAIQGELNSGIVSTEHCFQFSDHVLAIKEVPHEWLLPRCSLAIHHGGAGTTAAVGRAGIPQVIFPVLGDQPFWAYVLGNKCGIAPKTWFHVKDLTEETVKQQIKAVDNEPCRNQAFTLGSKLRNDCGVDTAVGLIQKYHNIHGNCGVEQNWVPDSKARSCLDCEEPFTLTFRRHHCRSCGNVYCYKCLSRRSLIGYSQDQLQLICTKCVHARETYNVKIPAPLPTAIEVAVPVAVPVVAESENNPIDDSL